MNNIASHINISNVLASQPDTLAEISVQKNTLLDLNISAYAYYGNCGNIDLLNNYAKSIYISSSTSFGAGSVINVKSNIVNEYVMTSLGGRAHHLNVIDNDIRDGELNASFWADDDITTIVKVFNNKLKAAYIYVNGSNNENSDILFKNNIISEGLIAEVSSFQDYPAGRARLVNNYIGGSIDIKANANLELQNGGEILFVNNTLVCNSGHSIILEAAGNSEEYKGQVSMYNNILWGDTSVDLNLDVTKNQNIGFSNNLVLGKTDVELNDFGGIASGKGNINSIGLTSDTLFVDYSGGNYRLRKGSPAINKGDNSFYDLSLFGNIDLDSTLRIQGAAIDMGAYEVYEQVISPCVTPLITQAPVTGGVCKGSDYVLSVKATGDNPSYQWYFNGNIILEATEDHYTISNASPSDYGYYHVRVTADCGRATSEPVVVWVSDPLPEKLTFAEYPNPAYVGREHLMRLSGWANVTSYNWRYEGTGNVTFNPIQGTKNETYIKYQIPGSGIVYVDMQHVCGPRTASISINASYPLSIDATNKEQLRVYPNPVRDVLTITLPQASSNLIELYDLTGRQVYSSRFDGSRLDLNISSWQKGTYIVKVTNGSGVLTKKIIKQ